MIRGMIVWLGLTVSAAWAQSPGPLENVKTSPMFGMAIVKPDGELGISFTQSQAVWETRTGVVVEERDGEKVQRQVQYTVMAPVAQAVSIGRYAGDYRVMKGDEQLDQDAVVELLAKPKAVVFTLASKVAPEYRKLLGDETLVVHLAGSPKKPHPQSWPSGPMTAPIIPGGYPPPRLPYSIPAPSPAPAAPRSAPTAPLPAPKA